MSSKKKRLRRTTGKDGGQHANQERRALKIILLHESVINNEPTHGIPTSKENLADETNRKKLMDNLKILHKAGVLKENQYFHEMKSVTVDLGEKSFSEPETTHYSLAAKEALKAIYEICIPLLPDTLELDKQDKCVRLRLYQKDGKGGKPHNDALRPGELFQNANQIFSLPVAVYLHLQLAKMKCSERILLTQSPMRKFGCAW